MDTRVQHPRQSRAGNSTATRQFVCFELAEQKYIFRIEQIQEIVIPCMITRIPEVPTYVEGVSNLRGTIIPIINLRLLFGLPPRAIDTETRTIVVNVGSRTMGCTVDAVARVIRVGVDDIHAAPDMVTASSCRSIEGFARIGEEILTLLDVDRLLDPDHLADIHRANLAGGHSAMTDSTDAPGAS
jgi:purine-binding chemotaxis protein CheW